MLEKHVPNIQYIITHTYYIYKYIMYIYIYNISNIYIFCILYTILYNNNPTWQPWHTLILKHSNVKISHSIVFFSFFECSWILSAAAPGIPGGYQDFQPLRRDLFVHGPPGLLPDPLDAQLARSAERWWWPWQPSKIQWKIWKMAKGHVDLAIENEHLWFINPFLLILNPPP